jgi:hypothetical protein
MAELENIDWWDSSRRSRDALVCVLYVGVAFMFVVLSPSGWTGLVVGLFVGSVNVHLSLHPDTRFYRGRLATTQDLGRCSVVDVTNLNLRQNHTRGIEMTLTNVLNCLLEEIGVVKEWVRINFENR